MTQLRLGALDFSPVYHGMPPEESLWHTLDVAPALESLGYHSLWLGEHYSPGIAHSSPEVLAGVLAGLTGTMRIGVAGVLLNLHAPLRVASAFRLLAALYPDRIDLGIARGGADPQRTSLMRERNPLGSNFEGKVAELLSYVHQVGDVLVSPVNTGAPKVWLLGSGTESARLAAANGTAFCFAAFFAKEGVEAQEVCSSYRAHFVPRAHLPDPECAIAVAGICGETAALAERSLDGSGPVKVRNTMLGTADTFREELGTIANSCDLTHFIFLEMSGTPHERLLSYTRLADALL